MNIVILNPLSDATWNELVMEVAGYNFFHSSNWARTLNEAYGFTPLYFSILDGKRLKALIPVMEIRSVISGCRGVSLPFSDYCNFLGGGDELKYLLEAVLLHGRGAGWKHVELRSNHQLLDGKPSSRCHYLHNIDLSLGEDALYRNLRDSTRRNIRKALKEGVSVSSSDSREAVSEFCSLNDITRRQHGIPPQPPVFFDRLYQNVIAQGMGRVYLSHYHGACIAGAIYVRFGDRIIYKYGASDSNYQQLRSNNLVMWEAIRSYSREGNSTFCFGRTEPDNEGLRQFKNGWGSREERVRYYRFNLQRNIFEQDSGNHGERYTKVLSRLPMPVLQTIGKYLYRHVG